MLVKSTVVQLEVEGGFRCGAFRVGVSQVIPFRARFGWFGDPVAFLARTPNDRLFFFWGGGLYGKHHHLLKNLTGVVVV